MLAELRTKSQITLPQDVVSTLGLAEGDKLDVFEREGVIYMVPTAVYSEKYIDALQEEAVNVRDKIRIGKQPLFSDVDAFIAGLEE